MAFSHYFKNILFIFRANEGAGEREGNKHPCMNETSISCLSHIPSQGPSHNLGMCLDQKSNWWRFGLWDDTQPIEQHQSGPFEYYLKINFHIIFLQNI